MGVIHKSVYWEVRGVVDDVEFIYIWSVPDMSLYGYMYVHYFCKRYG